MNGHLLSDFYYAYIIQLNIFCYLNYQQILQFELFIPRKIFNIQHFITKYNTFMQDYFSKYFFPTLDNNILCDP